MRRRALGLAVFAGATLGGAALGYLGERRVVEVRGRREGPRWTELNTPPAVEERTITSFDGTQLRVVTAGRPDAPTLVLSHSYAMSWQLWNRQIRGLAEEFRVVAYDHRGHAGSSPAADGSYTIAALAGDLRVILDEVAGDGPVVVVGHSMGGMTIMGLAGEHPGVVAERLAGAVLLNTASSRVSRALLTGLRALLGLATTLPGPRRTGRPPELVSRSDVADLIMRRLVVDPDADPAVIAFVEDLAFGCYVDALAGFARMFVTLDLDDALANLDVPTLVVAAEHDRLTPPSQSQRLAEALPQARLVEIPDRGHMTPLEDPEQVTGLIREHARRCFASAEPV